MERQDYYINRYRALGKQLEVERLRVSRMMSDSPESRRLAAEEPDMCARILLELNELEDLLYKKGD